jgi:two-component system LytT family sensor kinase
MTPPPASRLDHRNAGTDLPLRTRPRYGLRWQVVLLVATALGIVSSALAWQFTLSLGRPVAYWRSLVILNCSYWYVWALFTPAIVWLSQHFRFEWRGLWRAFLVHIPAVAFFSFGHIAAMSGVQLWLATMAGKSFWWWQDVQRSALQNFDWEMITYWAIAGLSHAVLYYRESRDRAFRTSQLETKLAEAQLAALQQQLHPHFLFNTLHAISALMHKDVEAADRTLMWLSDLLRLTLENIGRPEVSLKAELEFLSKYLEIEQTRFADRLTVQFDIQPETLDARVPNLILQPLVENAIKHGVAKKAGPGHIQISTRRDGDKLWMEVRDDGVGLSEDGWRALHKGIGVSTTRERLLRLFGADFRFEFHRHNPGLAVIVAFPWRVDSPPAESANDVDRIDQDGNLRAPSPPSRPWRVSTPDTPTTTMTGYSS